MVVIDNHNAGVKAMVGGPNFETKPFNLATQGHRQPGSSIKPFTLITALEEGISPYTTFESAPQYFHYGKHGQEIFEVNNDEDSYLGSCSIVCATTYSDNSIYAQLGLEGLKGKTIQDRTHSIAGTIHKMGYDDPISTNPAMVLGGLEVGVTPLGWTYAYSTIGNNGDRVSGTLAPRPGDSPVAYTQVTDKDGHTIKGGDNDSIHDQVIPEGVAEEAKSILETVVSSGTGTNAQIGAEGQWGKTGHDREQRRRLVLRRGRRRSDRLRLGRLRRHDDADDDALQRRPGDGRHLPGADLGQRDLGLGGNQGRTRRRSQGKEGEQGRLGLRLVLRRLDRSGAGILGRNRSGAGTGSSEPSEPEARSQKRRKPPNRRNQRRPNRRRRRAAAASPPDSRLRDVGAAGGAEAPGALDRFGDADPGAGDHLRPVPGSGGSSRNGSRPRSASFCSRPMPSASVSLPGPEQSSRSGRSPRRSLASAPGRRSARARGSAPPPPRPRVRRRS